MKNFYKNNPPRFWFIVSAVLVTLIAAFGLFFVLYMVPNSYVFKIGDKKFTKKDFDVQSEFARKKAIYMSDASLADTKTVKEVMIETELIKLMAKNNNITVSDTEIDERLETALAAYKAEDATATEDSVYSAYESSYGYDKTLLREKIGFSILREKVKSTLVKSRSGRYIYASFGAAGGDAKEATPEELETAALKKINGVLAQLDAGKDFEALYKQYTEEDNANGIGTLDVSLDADTQEMDEAEKQAILTATLNTPTKVVKAQTYYAIYLIDKENSGKYQSWDQLLTEYKNNYLSYGLITFSEQQKFALAIDTLMNKVGVKTAFASCAGCSGCRGSYINGTVTDTVLGEAISGATVRAFTDAYMCDGSTSSTKYAWCGPSSKTATTSSTGYYKFSRADGNGCFANCGGGSVHWRLSYSKDGFTPQTSGEFHTSNGGGQTKNRSLVPTLNSSCTLTVPSSTVRPGQSFTATYTATNTGAIKWVSESGFKLGESTTNVVSWGTGGRVAMSASPINPGGTVNFYITAKAPNTVGDYGFAWQMLKEGYAWFGSTCGQTIMVRANAEATALTCRVTPQTGLAPLVVTAEATATGLTSNLYDYRFVKSGGGEDILTGRGTKIYYTLSTPGTYNTFVRNSSYTPPGGSANDWVQCGPADLPVGSPSDQSGGEVAP